MPEGWEWDETLFAGSAAYYAQGRLPYAAALPGELARAMDLDGTGRLLDVGCGPGIVTLMLAPLFAEAIGVDPDAGMLAEAKRRANALDIANVSWIQARGEALTPELGQFRVVTFAQSFHWMDQPRVAGIVFDLLGSDGALVHINNLKPEDGDPAPGLPHPSPPYDAIRALIRQYLGPERRAGQGVLRFGIPGNEAEVFRAAGFEGPTQLIISSPAVCVRTQDEIVAWVYSHSSMAPHLFGETLGAFETELRRLLADASPSGLFADAHPDTIVFIWPKPGLNSAR